jgi:hypothetical protein
MTTPTERPSLWPQKAMSALLFVGFISYITITVALSGFLLSNAYLFGAADFEKLAITALIAVIGTGLTALATVYSSNRQALAANQVELLKEKINTDLLNLTAKINRDLAVLKTISDRSLERLKMSLDAEKNAYREISGAAATYFYSLRSVALNTWDEGSLKIAEDGMVAATRHLIYVDDVMRNAWMDFWQNAQAIYRNARDEKVETKRPSIVEEGMNRKLSSDTGKHDFRDQYGRVEQVARLAVARETSPETGVPAAPGGP